MNGVAAILIVLALAAALAWLAGRGRFAGFHPRQRVVTVETAVGLGERRSLVVVAVEGRRLLLGMTPSQITLLTDLAPAAPDAAGGNVS